MRLQQPGRLHEVVGCDEHLAVGHERDELVLELPVHPSLVRGQLYPPLGADLRWELRQHLGLGDPPEPWVGDGVELGAVDWVEPDDVETAVYSQRICSLRHLGIQFR